MKNRFKYLVLVIIGIVTFIGGVYRVEAATLSVDKSTSNRIYYNNNTKYTFYNKMIDDEVAYCTQLTYKVPDNGTSYTVYQNQYHTESYVAGILINHVKTNVGTDKNAYLTAQYVLNCYLKDNGYYSNVCGSYSTLIAEASKLVSDNYRYNNGSSTQKLPSISVTGGYTLASSGKYGEYSSKKMTVNGMVSSYGGNIVTYKVSVSSSNHGDAYICSGNTYSSSTCSKSVTVSNKDTYSFYVVVKDGGVDGGNAKIKISGSNSSAYHSSILWTSGNTAYQNLATYKKVTITRDRTLNVSFYYAASNKYSASLTKTNEYGDLLEGAKLNLFTADKEDGTGNRVDVCTIESGSSCSRNDLVAGDSNGYQTGRYLCFEEIESPEGYVKINGKCEQIAIGEDNVYYYKNGEKIDESEYNKYSNSQLYCVSRTGEEIDDTYVKEKIGELGVSSDIKDGACEVITSVNKQSVCIMNDDSSKYYKSGTTEYSSNCENSDTNTGTKYCVTRISEEIDDTYISGVISNGLSNNENLEIGECVVDTPIYSTSICLYDQVNKGYYGYNTDGYNEYCVNKSNYSFSKFEDVGGSYSIIASNTMNKVSISKKAINGTAELPGATLAIYKTNASGECTDNLAKALEFKYQPYVYKGTSGSTVEDNDSDISIKIEDTDSDEDNNTEDSDTSSDVKVDDSGYLDPAVNGLKWTSSYAPVTISGLSSGTYCLTEEIAPSGYERITTTTKFSIDDKGEVKLVDDGNESVNLTDGTISLYNKLVEFSISKQDMATKKELPGATLSICVAAKNDKGKYEVVTDYSGYCTVATLADGTPATWVSTEEEHVVKGLAAGTYFLVEQVAPSGYAEAESILFTVDNKGNILDEDGKSVKNNKIVMYDEIFKEVPTGDVLKIVIISLVGVMATAGVIVFLNRKKIFKRKI